MSGLFHLTQCFHALSMMWFLCQNFISFKGWAIFLFIQIAYFVYPFPRCFHLLAIVSNTAVSWSLRAPITKSHKLGARKQQKCIAHTSGGWKSKTRVRAWSAESFLLHLQEAIGSTMDWLSFIHLFIYYFFLTLFYKSANPIHEGPALITSSLSKGPT